MNVDADWAEHALCRGLPIEVFFDLRMSSMAIAACGRCPVLSECRRWTDQTEARTPLNALAGVFGAETPRQRHRRRANERLRELPLSAA